VDLTSGTSRHLSTPKRLARVARLRPRPSRRSWRPDPAATHLSAFSEVMGPLLVHPSADSPKSRRHTALRPFREARPVSRRSSLSSRRLWGAHSSVVANSHDHAVDLTVGIVANQESHARSKQQRDDPRQLRLVRLAHCPGDPVVPSGAARLLSAWQRRSEARAAARAEAVVARSVPARLHVRDRDGATGLLCGRFPASTITCCMGTGRTEGPLRPRAHGCRLARRSGHLVPAGTRAALFRPTGQRALAGSEQERTARSVANR